MDPHFNEYLAVVAGMQEMYGEAGDDMPTDFQQAIVAEVVEAAA